jgi:hypothetical protein
MRDVIEIFFRAIEHYIFFKIKGKSIAISFKEEKQDFGLLHKR